MNPDEIQRQEAERDRLLRIHNQPIPQHDQIVRGISKPLEQRVRELERENEELKKEIKRLTECDCGNELSAGKCQTCDNDE